jgi:hypothetical protein
MWQKGKGLSARRWGVTRIARINTKAGESGEAFGLRQSSGALPLGAGPQRAANPSHSSPPKPKRQRAGKIGGRLEAIQGTFHATGALAQDMSLNHRCRIML